VTAGGAPDGAASGGPGLRRLEAAAPVLLAVLPLAVLYSRAAADMLISLLGLMFLLRCALAGEWGWTRAGWARLAGAFWLWIVLCSLLTGQARPVLQGLAMGRMLLFVAALSEWLLAVAATRRLLWWAVLAAAAWIGLQAWQQFLLGVNLFGDPRWGDGALTGPFRKPEAGSPFVLLLFPAFLPPVLTGLRGAGWRRVAGLALLLAVVATTVLIGQRMPTLLMLLGLLVTALLIRRLRLPVLAALAVGGVLLALTPVLSPPTYGKLVLRFADQMEHFGDSAYGLLFARAGVMLEAHPWTGQGFDGFRLHCGDAAYQHPLPGLGTTRADGGGLEGCNLHPHNYYLDVAVSGGLPGLVLFVALVAAWLRAAGRGLRDAAAVRVGLFASVVVALWPVASTSALFTIPTAGWVFLLLGWALGEARAADSGLPGRMAGV